MANDVTDPNINRDEHDEDGGVTGKRIKNYVWNSSTLAWDKETQSGGGGGGGTVNQGNTIDSSPVSQNITVVDSGSTSTTGANNQNIVTGSPTAGSAASFTLAGYDTVRVQVTGTWTGTLTSEISIDGGTTWIAVGLHQGAYTTSTFTANFVGGANVAGATNYRLRATATITGTATVKVVETVNEQSIYLANAAPSGNIVSILNSSTATLTSGSVYTGTGEDASNFGEIRVSVKSDVASATDGLSIQQSPDNTNWDITDVYTIPANLGKTFVVPRQARYYRIVYTNGGTNQASFRLQSILDRAPTAASSQRPSDARPNDNDMVETLSYPMIYDNVNNQWNRDFHNVVAGDAGFNGVAMVSGVKTLTFTTSASGAQTLLANTDVRGYSWIEIVYTSVGSGLALTGQFAPNTGGTYLSQSSWTSAPNAAPISALGVANGIVYVGPVRGNFFQIAVSALTSGTFTGTVTLRSTPPPFNSTGVAQVGTWNVGSSSATGSAVPANAFYIGGSLGGNLAAPLMTSGSSDATALGNSLYVAANGYNYNGATFDRQRANNTAALIAAGTTSTQSNITFITYNGKKLELFINVASATAATLTVAVNGVSSSAYSTNIITSTAIATTGLTILRIFPSATPTANLVANDMLPRTVSVTASVTGTVSYGIDYVLGV